MYQELPLLKCGYSKADIETAKPEDMDLYYTPEQQAKYGVLGIEIIGDYYGRSDRKRFREDR